MEDFSPPLPSSDECAIFENNGGYTNAVQVGNGYSPAFMAVVFGLRMIVAPCARRKLLADAGRRGPILALTHFLKAVDQGARRRLTFLSIMHADASTDEKSLAHIISDAQRGCVTGCAARALWLVRPVHQYNVIKAAKTAADDLRRAGLVLPPPPQDINEKARSGGLQAFEVVA